MAANILIRSALSLLRARSQGVGEIKRRYHGDILKKCRTDNVSSEEAGITAGYLHKLMKMHGTGSIVKEAENVETDDIVAIDPIVAGK